MPATSKPDQDKRYYGAVCPHPPILLPAVGRGREAEARATRMGMEAVAAQIAKLRPRVIFCVTPHGPAAADAISINLSQHLDGGMEDFGAPATRLSFAVDPKWARRLASALEQAGFAVVRETQERARLDHGCFVPLWFIRQAWPHFRLVRLSTSLLSVLAHQKMGAIARDLVAGHDEKPLLLASADLSHVLREDGPYGYHPAGPAFDQRVADMIQTGAWPQLATITPRLVEEAAQCGLRPLAVLAGYLCGMGKETPPVETEVFSYEGPYGVGYLTAFARGEDMT